MKEMGSFRLEKLTLTKLSSFPLSWRGEYLRIWQLQKCTGQPSHVLWSSLYLLKELYALHLDSCLPVKKQTHNIKILLHAFY